MKKKYIKLKMIDGILETPKPTCVEMLNMEILLDEKREILNISLLHFSDKMKLSFWCIKL